jgi:hypothetical protein
MASTVASAVERSGAANNSSATNANAATLKTRAIGFVGKQVPLVVESCCLGRKCASGTSVAPCGKRFLSVS